jgi:uroporphyrinogen decarboxylase
MSMTPRERILAAINHTEPDQLPVDIGATPSSGISAIAYDQLIKHLEFKDQRNWVYDVVQQVTQPSAEFLDRFRIDAVDVGRMFNTRNEDWYNYTLANGNLAQQPNGFRPEEQPDGSYLASLNGEVIAKMPVGATFYDQTVYPFLDGYPDQYGQNMDQAMGRIHWAGLAHSPWDHAGEVDFWEQLRSKAIQLRESSDRAIMVVAGCNLFEWGTFLRRLDNFLMDLLLDQANVERLLDALMERHLKTLENVCNAVGDVVDILRFGDDLGMDTGPFMKPEIYQKLFKPRHTILCDYVKKNSSMHTFLHSCGSIYKLIPDLIEAGFEILNPVQINSRDMQPERLKAEFGADVVFWGGGADTRSILNRATPEVVKEHVRKNIEIFAPGGGFVFNTVHNIMPDVPPENILAMFAAIDEYR